MAVGDVKVTLKFEGIQALLKELSSKKVKKEVGQLVVDEMKTFIAAGVSPVRGHKRFENYKDPDSYPGEQKSKRPVNLNLSGDMLAALTYKMDSKSKYGVRVGWFTGLLGGSKQRDKAMTHNNGTATSGNAAAFRRRQIKKLVGRRLSNKSFDSKLSKINSETKRFDKGGIPQRKMLPTGEGETFNITIIRKIRYLYSFIISDILKR